MKKKLKLKRVTPTKLGLPPTHLHPRRQEGASVDFGGRRASALSGRLFGRGASWGIIHTKIHHAGDDSIWEGSLQVSPSLHKVSRPLSCEATLRSQSHSAWVLKPSNDVWSFTYRIEISFIPGLVNQH